MGKKQRHPMQRLHVDDRGVVRFRQNALVRHLLDNGGIDLNMLARLDVSDEDRMQFAQLIGYSVSGYGDLSYASKKSVRKAAKRAAEILDKSPPRPAKGGCES
jgi:hypothetical protein